MTPLDHTDIALARERTVYKHAIVDWCFEKAAQSFECDNITDALTWNAIAARVLATGCDPLMSPRLENNLLRIAATLPTAIWTRNTAAGPCKNVLHIIDRALPYGGHTAMACRWIELDSTSTVHSVALTNQQKPVPDKLRVAVNRCSGTIAIPPSGLSPLRRAAWLREFAYTTADYIVLHIDVHNVIVPVAFGVTGGPPVLTVNHAAHVFWTGATITDLVLNCRGSQLEHIWTTEHRGIARCATLPIPLTPDHTDVRPDRSSIRDSLGLPHDSPVLLTVGEAYKYTPIGSLSFARVLSAILTRCPTAHVILIGPDVAGHWTGLTDAYSGRVHFLGRQLNVSGYHAAADVYIEGFPFGSTTALLEAGASGLPVVLAPEECPPPFGTDGVALDSCLARPRNVQDYIDTVAALISDHAYRQRLGGSLRRSVLQHHTGNGWRKYLTDCMERAPCKHSVYTATGVKPIAADVTAYWATFRAANLEGDPLMYASRLAVEAGIPPIVNRALLIACIQASNARRHTRLSIPVLVCLGMLLKLCPRPFRERLYDYVMTLVCRAVNGCLFVYRAVLRHLAIAFEKVLGNNDTERVPM